jgi:hypothetical protein
MSTTVKADDARGTALKEKYPDITYGRKCAVERMRLSHIQENWESAFIIFAVFTAFALPTVLVMVPICLVLIAKYKFYKGFIGHLNYVSSYSVVAASVSAFLIIVAAIMWVIAYGKPINSKKIKELDELKKYLPNKAPEQTLRKTDEPRVLNDEAVKS